MQEKLNTYKQASEEAWAKFYESINKREIEATLYGIALGNLGDAKQEYEYYKNIEAEAADAWATYYSLKDSNNAKIKNLQIESAEEHEKMKECYSLSNKAKNEKKGFLGDKYSQDGITHRDRRDAINEEIAELKRQIFTAKKQAEEKEKARLDSLEKYEDSEEDFKWWKEKFNIKKDDLAAVEAECDLLHAEAEEAQKRYELAEEEYYNAAKLEENKPLIDDIFPKEEEEHKTLAVFDELREEYNQILKEDEEIMRVLHECKVEEICLRKISDIDRKIIKKNWKLDKKNVDLATRKQKLFNLRRVRQVMINESEFIKA